MSWWTGDGHVTLPTPVIELLAEAALALREEIVEEIIHDNPDLHVEVGVPAFDSLDAKTQVFTLAYVLRHLSDATLPSPALFAWNEGTAWAMFVKAGQELAMEIDLEADAEGDTKFLFRRLVRDALKAVDPSARRRAVRSRNLDAWSGDIDEIAEHLLWDRDFLDEGTFADMHPDLAASVKRQARIDDNYFTTPPPLVREQDYREADRFLRTAAGCSELLDPWHREGR